MDYEVGSIITGKVTGITKFGAFITVAPGKSGLVHISEIATSYVSNVRDHLTEGQDVTVKIIGTDQNGRLNLSIKAAATPPQEEQQHHRVQQRPRPPETVAEPTFEDKLKRFMQDSDSKISGLKQYPEKKGTRRRGR